MVQASIRLNPAWIDGERRGSAQRAANARATQQYIQQRSSEIVENRRQANAEIAHGMWRNMTNQEDYVNPHTGEPEYGSNQYKHRWQSANGDVIYTDDPKYDPNWDQSVKRTDYKRSQPRPR
ncbi:MAG: hypothetical protein NT090_03360 [Acidobacteria bacterium]|nr:hypothetical protein [Acidobacteriota bacterium]